MLKLKNLVLAFALLISSAWSLSAHATYAFVGSGVSSATAGGTPRTITYSPTIGNVLVVVAVADTIGSSLVVSDGTNTYTYINSLHGGSFYVNLFTAPVTGSATTMTLTKGGGGGNLYGFYVAEYSGISATPTTAQFQSQYQNGPGSGANLVTTTTEPDVTSVPAMLWALTVDVSQIAGGTNAGAPSVGTTLSYNSRTVAWVSGGASNSAVASDIRITSAGSNPTNFTAGSPLQFDQFETIAVPFPESGGSCTHGGFTSAGALSTPNGSSGSYPSCSGTIVTPNCSSVTYFQPSGGACGVN